MAKAGPYLNYAKSTAKTPAEKEEATRLLAEVDKALPPLAPKPEPKPAPKAAAPPPAPAPAPPKPQPAGLDSVLKMLKDCADDRKMEAMLTVFKEAQKEFPKSPELFYTFGILMSQALTNNAAYRGPLPRKMAPLVEESMNALQRALSLAPKNPKADQARLYLEKLRGLSAEGVKPERRP